MNSRAERALSADTGSTLDRPRGGDRAILVSLEGLRWSLATGAYKGELYLSLRLNDRRFNAGKLVREVCSAFGGSAGGHGAMAGARIPLDGRTQEDLAQQLAAAFLKVFHLRAGPGTPLVPQP